MDLNTALDDGRQYASEAAEQDDRRMILESYEKAGVDLPLVSLETVLDREISEYDARQTGAPRFRQFLNKASSAITNRTLNAGKLDFELGPDDEISVNISSSSYTSNSNAENESLPVEPLPREASTEMPQTPDRLTNDNKMIDGTMAIIPPTPESMKNGCPTTFDFCCPDTGASPSKSNSSDKYVTSNLQLAEGFDDEQQGTDFQESRAVPALMDFEGSILDESLSTEKQRNPGPIHKKGYKGLLSFFRGSRRFQYAVLFCCMLHIVLIGLIIAFFTNMEKDNYETGSSSSISQEQTTAISTSTDTGSDIITSETLLPETLLPETLFPETLLPDPGLEDQEVPIAEAAIDSNDITNSTMTPTNTDELDNLSQEVNQEVNTTIDSSIQEDQKLVSANNTSPASCVDSLDVSMTCVDQDSELYVSFESCSPQVGDWVAIYEASADPQSLSNMGTIGWLYTCGDRLCEEAVQKEVLSFTRAKNRAGIGRYRAHLIRQGVGPTFTALASSPAFRVVANSDRAC